MIGAVYAVEGTFWRVVPPPPRPTFVTPLPCQEVERIEPVLFGREYRPGDWRDGLGRYWRPTGERTSPAPQGLERV